MTKEDEVATLLDGQFIEYNKPTHIFEYDYDDDLYHIKSQQVDLMVTPNHKMYVRKGDNKSKPFELLRADEIMKKHVQYKKDGIKQGEDQKHFVLNKKQYDMDAWLQLIAIFIADGCLEEKNKKVILAAIKPCKIKVIQETCEKIGITVKSYYSKLKNEAPKSKYNNMNGQHYISDRDIYDYFVPYNVGANNKCLPEFVWSLNQRQSRLLLDTLISCDGSYNKSNAACYYTSSKRLANEVQILALHAGWSGNFSVRYPAGTQYTIRGKTGSINYDYNCVRIVKNKNTPSVNHSHVKEQKVQTEEMVPYKGKVYCCEVKNHVIYVRRNGKPSWTGNSRHGQQASNTRIAGTSRSLYY